MIGRRSSIHFVSNRFLLYPESGAVSYWAYDSRASYSDTQDLKISLNLASQSPKDGDGDKIFSLERDSWSITERDADSHRGKRLFAVFSQISFLFHDRPREPSPRLAVQAQARFEIYLRWPARWKASLHSQTSLL